MVDFNSRIIFLGEVEVPRGDDSLHVVDKGMSGSKIGIVKGYLISWKR